MSWARLLTRVFAIDITTCPQYGGPLTILAAIEEPAVISKILAHLGLPTRAPPRAPARLDEFFQTASSPRRIPVQFLEPTDRLCPFSQPTPHKGAPGWPDPRTRGRADLTHRRNSRMSDRNVWGLNPQHGSWYFAGQSKRPFKFPIPKITNLIDNFTAWWRHFFRMFHVESLDGEARRQFLTDP